MQDNYKSTAVHEMMNALFREKYIIWKKTI